MPVSRNIKEYRFRVQAIKLVLSALVLRTPSLEPLLYMVFQTPVQEHWLRVSGKSWN